MSSTLSPQQSNTSRPWWSRSSSSKSLNNDKPSAGPAAKQSGSKKLNTLATAIGLKPKKAALAIQDPPSPVLPLHTPDIEEPPPLTFMTRPPAKSVSTVRSWDDLPEPRTPSEPSKDRSSFSRSVLTVSDMDPFASRYVGPGHDHARLSVFSDSSASDSHGKNGDHSSVYNRTSYASSSSNSHQRADVTSDMAAMASSSLMFPDDKRVSRLTVESEKIVRREPPFFPRQSPPVSPNVTGDRFSDSRPRIRSSASSTTLTDKRPHNAPAVPPLKARLRGMTESASSSRRGPLPSSDTRPTPSPYPTNISPIDSRPRVIVRQPSLNRVQPLYPPSAPPTAGLPAPPQRNAYSSSHVHLGDQLREPSPASTNSSSSLSFASSASSYHDRARARTQSQGTRGKLEKAYTANDRARVPAREGSRGRSSGAHVAYSALPSQTEFSPTRTLKKAISQQSLPKRSSGSGVPSASAVPDDCKPLKKQRSFHHSRIPIPPMPASLWHSHSSPPPMPSGHEDSAPIIDQRRGSGNSVFGIQSSGATRKRLFSGSSMRRSTSSHAPSADDDGHSIFSSPGEDYRFSGSATSAGNRSDAASSSFWDEADGPTSPSGMDYIPQQIMSPADMLRVEALLQEESQVKASRPRGESFTSVSTSMSNALSIGTSGSHARSDWASHEEFSPISETAANSHNTQAPRLGARGQYHRPISLLAHNTSPPVQTNVRPSTAQTSPSRTSFFGASGSSFGLPPPPRPRPSTATGADSSLGVLGHRTSLVQMSPLSPPPAWKNNIRRAASATAAEKAVPPQRRSIMKKPSFLDIDDEREKAKSPDPGDNFLDMDFGKASFDTVRSEEDRDEFGLR